MSFLQHNARTLPRRAGLNKIHVHSGKGQFYPIRHDVQQVRHELPCLGAEISRMHPQPRPQKEFASW
jgi:hypothetical protein